MAALQVGDLFDAQAAEAPIQRLVAVLNAQAAQIRELQQALRAVQATQRQTVADCDALRAAVSPLDPRVVCTERDVAALKQFKAAAQQQLQAFSRQLQTKCDRQELRDAEVRAKTRSESTAEQLRNELASLQLVECLQTQQSELHERLETVDRRLSAKMDKSEATRLDGVLVQIHRFRPLAAHLSAQVEQVRTQQSETERAVARLDSETQTHRIDLDEIRQQADQLEQMLDEAEDRHRRAVVPQIQRLDDSTVQLKHALDQVKTAAATSEAALRTLSAKLHSSAGAFASQLEQQVRHFEVDSSKLLRKRPRA
ncbi:Pyridoxal kinase [Phytophthora cinnamomi]|uniref:Pyridoxal kinase n=1 Tax=Phytophthora cinnamomi TaxID=4785 RepID=UPI003559DF56|nr:Pyridoxal kinase [Phytophthora cinnamomi]